MYMKKYFIYSAALLALVSSCQSDDFLGNNGGNVQTSGNETAINFAGGTGKITRAAVKNGEEAANLLKKHFVVFGDKTTDGTTYTVYDHYDVQWKGTDAANKTQSNQKGWEYVGLAPNKNSNLATDAKQTIKYWDYSASEYNFAAFSMGGLTPETGENNTYDNQAKYDETGNVTSGKVKISQIEKKATKYTIEGSADNIAKLYISDRVTAKPSGSTPDIKYQDAVQFNFRALKSLVRLGIFETIPGYSVKDVKFYSSTNTTSTQATNTPGLYAEEANIPAGDGKATITFGKNTADGSYNKAMVAWASENNKKDIYFENLILKGVDSKEEPGTTNLYIGRAANEASTTDYETVIPSTEIGALTLKVDYTLVSTDGSKEEIKVTGATATVPSEYTQWQPNYSYTYIFKISDKTNGSTGGNTEGLYPIVFDAIVTETETGKQETITTVETRSITTYAKGAINNNEYKTGDNIYVSVSGTNGTSEKLYEQNTTAEEQTVSYTYYATLYKLSGTTESITEAEAKAILDNKKSLGGKTLTEVGTYSKDQIDTQFVSQIDATDAVDGVAVTGNFFKFTPTKTTDAGTYVFAYKKGQTESYKVIKVAAN